MPKQSAVAPEEMMALSYPPPRGDTGGGVGIHNQLSSQLEIGGSRVSSSVDSMKASSPPHWKAASPAAGTVTHINDDAYGAWMKQHPSALARFEEIVEASKGKQIAMFLDYDGTLSQIVQDPDRAFMSDSMRAAVKDVARFFPTAIVSGRCTAKVYNFVELGELFYAGSHGMDIKGPCKVNKHTKTQGKTVCFQPASEYLPMIDEVYNVLLEKMKSIPGSNVENNKFCLSVHFRCVDEKRWSSLADQVISVINEYPELYLTEGKMVLEIRPNIEWDKGKALEFLLETFGFDDSNDVFPIYIGDDRTDEDAFKVLRKRGQGIGILVSKTPKETSSSYSVQEPAEVMDFLHRLVDWERASPKGLSKM